VFLITIKELPVSPVLSYFLCDSWYTSETIINTFAKKGFHMRIYREKIQYIFQYVKSGGNLDELLKMVGEFCTFFKFAHL